MNTYMDISDTKDGPETCSQEMAPSSLFQTMTPTKTSGELLVFGEWVFCVVNQRRTFTVLDYVD
jgi:hypothetical protein